MIIDSFIQQAKTVVEHFVKILSEIRLGTASPSLVENVLVDAYGAKTPLLQLASIQVPEARVLLIQPWDKSILKDIERSLQAADLGTSPIVEGDAIRIVIPPLTEERRLSAVKEIGQKKEEARVRLRQARDKIREEVETNKKQGAIAEDEKFRHFKEIDKKMQEFSDQIEKSAKEKEEKVMKV